MGEIRCVECGRFISYEDKKAKVYFEPDSDRGPEVVEWTCGRCLLNEKGFDVIENELGRRSLENQE